jgi:hypothetical protein
MCDRIVDIFSLSVDYQHKNNFLKVWINFCVDLCRQR